MGDELQYAWISGFSLFALILTVYIIVKCCGCCVKTIICKPFVMVFILFTIFILSTIAIVKDADTLANTPQEEALKEGERFMAPINALIDPITEMLTKKRQTDI